MGRVGRCASFVQLLLPLATFPILGGISKAAEFPAAAMRSSALESTLHDVVLPAGKPDVGVVFGAMLEDSLMGDMVLNEIGDTLAKSRLDPARLESRLDRVTGAPAAWPSLSAEGRKAHVGETAASRLSLARPQITSLTTGRQVGASAQSRVANEFLPLSREVFPLLVNVIPDHASFTLASNRLPNSAAVVGVRPAYLKPAAFR